jgi:hypothetical protein
MHLVSRMVEGKLPIVEPVLEGKGDFAEVFFLEHILVPDDEFDDAEAIGKGEVDGKVERGVFGGINRVDGPLRDGGLMAIVEEARDDEARREVSQRRSTRLHFR